MAMQVLEGPGVAEEAQDSANTVEALDHDDEIHLLLLVEEKEPTEFLLGTLEDARLRVVRPLQVALTKEEGDFVAEAPEINEFGFGDSQRSAVRDLQRAIVLLYFSLERDNSRLGPELTRTLEALKERLAVPRH